LKEIGWFYKHFFFLHHVIVYDSFIIAAGFSLGRRLCFFG
jgi:hypothetical protein